MGNIAFYILIWLLLFTFTVPKLVIDEEPTHEVVECPDWCTLVQVGGSRKQFKICCRLSLLPL
jgi:hypothetical protein